MNCNNWEKIKKNVFFDSYGMMSIGFFLVCVLSGIFLAIPYDVHDPYSSIGRLLIANPWASFFRNLHYWSAQFFLIFIILHVWEYLGYPKDFKVKTGIWFRLVVSLLFVFWVMLSGFFLKADADSLQARRILETLLSSIPIFGDILSYSVLGPENDLQIIYVHHLATTSIFIALIILEHAHTIWGKLKTFIISLILISLLSIAFQAPLHNNLDPIMKGPWYFLGLQEILHWLSHPGFSLLLIFSILVLIYFLPSIKSRPGFILKKTLLYSFYVYLILTLIGNFFRGENWKWIWPWDDRYSIQIHTPFNPIFMNLYSENDSLKLSEIPVVLGREESCLICHSGMKGFSPAHSPDAIGCVSCHGGNSFALNKKQAHKNMILIPGDNLDAERSCGTTNCHPDIPQRVKSSLMSTLSGMITVDRYVFGETKSLSEISHVHDLKQTAADNHLRDLCASCHLGNSKIKTGPITQLSRGGGCNACHLNYSNSALMAYKEYHASGRKDNFHFTSHPSLSIKVSNDHCFGCHSRSGRISTNYEGWHETQLDEHDSLNTPAYRILEDHRIFTFVEDDIHHRKGLACIDCHNSYELMGDGEIYAHKEDQVQVACEDCHLLEPPQTLNPDKFDSEAKKILELRPVPQETNWYLTTKKTARPIVNIFINKHDSVKLFGKISGKIHTVLTPADVCTRGNAHDDLTCSACHTSWAPRCLGCHTDYEPNTPGYDIYANKFTRGSWIEYAGKYLAIPPSLGVEYHSHGEEVSERRIKTAVPGMILTVNKNSYNKNSDTDLYSFHRLFAPAEAHTIQAEGRTCKSCHNDPVALGYGEGKLYFDLNTLKWSFIPRYQLNKYDRLPEDAWIGFLTNNKGVLSTRENFRPFNLKEQKNILLVGVCLTCHDENSKIMMESLDDFQGLIDHRSPECKIPDWQ